MLGTTKNVAIPALMYLPLLGLTAGQTNGLEETEPLSSWASVKKFSSTVYHPFLEIFFTGFLSH